jgi:hypothetical protein
MIINSLGPLIKRFFGDLIIKESVGDSLFIIQWNPLLQLPDFCDFIKYKSDPLIKSQIPNKIARS